MKTILITGGAGFIGSNLADSLLADGHQVVVVDNFNDYYDIRIKEQNVSAHLHNPRYKLYRADIEDQAALQKIFSAHRFDVVVHLAARAGVRPSLEQPLEYVKSNILGTVNILECMKTAGCTKLVVASSSSVYGNCAAEEFSENLKVTEPISPYAATKSATEQLCYTWHHLYGIKVVALRFFTVYGRRQRPDLAIHKFARLIDNGQPIEMYGTGETVRDYTYIDDILSGIKAAIDYEKTGYEIINLGGGEPISLKKMIATLEDALGKKAVIEPKPMQLGDVNKTVCDWRKAHELLGYTPQTTFKQGIDEFIKWYKKSY
ncbi:MAG: SDR family NAD(P)-dependent oxidoreductase [Alphaproteobacteria bacterium]|nr:SDR family NAD(P)-dependent oxidoreductase [Alphaproteobacteria bacterium]